MRRQPTFFREAVETCRNESSFLTSSKSVSEVNYAKKGLLALKVSITVTQCYRKSPTETHSKLQFDLKTHHTWINTTILNLTHAQDGNEIVLIKETPYGRFAEYPRLPSVVLYSMDTHKLQIGVMETQGRVSF